jgi:hypothetical protein
MERYRGVLTWFAGPVADSDAYLAWASQVSRLNVRYVMLGDIGVAINSANIIVVNRLLDLAGVRHTGDFVAPTLKPRKTSPTPSPRSTRRLPLRRRRWYPPGRWRQYSADPAALPRKGLATRLCVNRKTAPELFRRRRLPR